jgi:hypothetical protein
MEPAGRRLIARFGQKQSTRYLAGEAEIPLKTGLASLSPGLPCGRICHERQLHLGCA